MSARMLTPHGMGNWRPDEGPAATESVAGADAVDSIPGPIGRGVAVTLV
jgi:hypothetical protein